MANKRTGQIQTGRPEPEAQTRLGQALPSAAVDVSSVFSQAALTLDRASDRIGTRADQVTRAESERQGKIDGAEADFRPTGGNTIAELSYDRAATNTYLDQLEAKTSSTLRTIYDAWQQDPDRSPSKLTASINAARDELLTKDAFPEIRGQVNARIERLRTPLESQARQDQLERTRDGSRAALVQNLSETATNIQRLASTDPNAPAVRAAVQEEVARTTARLDAGVRSGTISEETAAKEKIKIVNQSRMTVAQSGIDRMATPDEVLASQTRLQKDFSEGKLPGLTADGYLELKSAHERRITQLRTEGNRDGALIEKRYESVVERAKQGLPVPDAEMRQLEQDADRTDRGKLARLKTEQQLNIVKFTRGQSPEQIDALAREMRKAVTAAGASPAASEQITFVEKLRDERRTALAVNQVGEANRVGILKTTPITFDDPRNLETQMARRTADARAIADNYRRPITYFEPDELANIQATVERGGKQAADSLRAIVRGAGKDAARVLAEISPKAPEVAAAAGLLATGLPGQADTARDLLDGQRMKGEPGAKRKVLASDEDNRAYMEVFGSGLGYMQENAARIRASAATLFSVRAERMNIDPASTAGRELMTTIYRELGGRTRVGRDEVGGVDDYKPGWWTSPIKVPVPQNVKAGRFQDVLRAIRDDDLKDLPGGAPVDQAGKPYGAAALGGTYPVRTGSGYRFSTTNPMTDTPKWLRGTDGNHFTLDIEQLEPRLRARVPGAFLGN